jgi:hypothetical protein
MSATKMLALNDCPELASAIRAAKLGVVKDTLREAEKTYERNRQEILRIYAHQKECLAQMERLKAELIEYAESQEP